MKKTALEIAKELDSFGFNVLPAKYKDKAPIIDWKPYQTERTTSRLTAWFTGARPFNFWIVCGAISRTIVLDCDNLAAVEYWRNEGGMGGSLDTTACVKTAKGYHFYFSIEENEIWPSWGHHEGGIDFDVRAEGSGVIAPPSIHETGAEYEWVAGRGPGVRGGAVRQLRGPRESQRGASTGRGPRSQLAGLLEAGAEEGGRNDWLTQVAGHFAKVLPFQDSFRATIHAVNKSLSTPLESSEAEKVINSIWGAENKNGTVSLEGGEEADGSGEEGAARREERVGPSEENGWLIGDGNRIWTVVRGKSRTGEDGDEIEGGLRRVRWSNFDIQALGIVEGGDVRAYDINIRTEGRPPQRDLLYANTLGSSVTTNAWLAQHGVNIVPDGDRRGKDNQRLQRYLESQHPPTSRAVDALGYYPGVGFVTLDEVITAEGRRGFETVVPHPKLRDWAPYYYGFIPEEEARDVLREVLTYQEEETAAVFGAYWAACWLKGQEDFGTSLWPYMAIEAPSESGKTRGFFALMMQLGGNKLGHGEATLAALRDQISAHRNGIVWIDDLSDITGITELLRQATGEGVRTKKGFDRSHQETVRLVSPIVISGESLSGILHEKAQRDRAILISATSPTERRSDRSDRPQWDDIQDLQRKYGGDITVVAGTICQMALRARDRVAELRELRGLAGRHNDKLGILRVGARILVDMTGEGKWIEIVDRWCGRQEDLGQENVLTTQALPALMQRDRIVPRTAAGAVPVFVDKDFIVWFNEEMVSQEWSKLLGPKDRAALAAIESIRMQRQALNLEGTGKPKSILGNRPRGMSDQQRRYHSLDYDMSRKVIERAGYIIDLNSGAVRAPIKGPVSTDGLYEG